MHDYSISNQAIEASLILWVSHDLCFHTCIKPSFYIVILLQSSASLLIVIKFDLIFGFPFPFYSLLVWNCTFYFKCSVSCFNFRITFDWTNSIIIPFSCAQYKMLSIFHVFRAIFPLMYILSHILILSLLLPKYPVLNICSLSLF